MLEFFKNIFLTSEATALGTAFTIIFGLCTILGFMWTLIKIFKIIRFKFLPFFYRYPCLRWLCIKNELFKNAFKSLEKNDMQDNTFLFYHYKNRKTPFVGRDSTMEDLDAFMKDTVSFSWYTIYGEAGTGKSRLTLELCKKYQNKNWECGFIDWDKISKNTPDWEKWRPLKPTLIVIDYAQNYLERTKGFINKIQETNQHNDEFFDLINALEILISNANKFEYNVRFLFLERGQEKIEESTLSEIKLFHEQLLAENPTLEGELKDSCYNFEKPLFLKELDSNEALQEIAESILKDNWPTYCKPNDFLERLINLDSKKRPLFAFILASLLNESKSDELNSKENVLKKVMQATFSSSKYQNLCREDLYLLILATMCSGLQSLPTTTYGVVEKIILPDVWNDTKICTKYISYGFAQKCSKNGTEFCTVLPLEPDLIGEFFLLEGFAHICIPSNNEELPLNILHDLAFTAWNYVPSNTKELGYNSQDEAQTIILLKILHFFERCGDDFPNEQLKLIVISLQNSFLTADDDKLKLIFALFWAVLLGLLIGKYSLKKNIHSAQDLLNAMTSHRNHKIIAMVHAISSSTLINYYANINDFKQAQKAFDTMNNFKNHEGVTKTYVKTAINLIDFYTKANKLEQAQKILNAMTDLEPNEENNILRANASVHLIEYYNGVGKLEESQKLFDAMADLGNHEKVTTIRAKAFFTLTSQYCTIGDLEQAQKLFDLMPNEFQENAILAMTHAYVSYNLIYAYLKANKLEQAQKIFDTMVNIKDSEEAIECKILAQEMLDEYKNNSKQNPHK